VPRDIKTTLFRLREILVMFYDIADDNYKKNLKILTDVKEMKKTFTKDYAVQKGFDIYSNLNIKIRCFWYGRKIQDFKPISNNFSCGTEQLSILADGNVLPCCLAYTNDISIGKVANGSLKSTLEGNKFLYNLRKKGGEKHITCRKCYGEPTYRGTVVKNLYFSLPEKIRHSKFLKSFTQSY
jgi:radical SAM protein with 4Fe4S-binding SPASM domain